MATFNSSSNVINNCVKSTESVKSAGAFSVPSSSPLFGLHAPNFASTSSAFENQSYIGIQQKNIPNLTHHHVNSMSSFTFMEIKREPCQVSEVTTSNNLHSNLNSKSMSSTMTTLVKIESTSPKMPDMDKSATEMHTNNSMQVGVALTRKKPQDSTPVQSPRDINYFGIRVADIGGVSAGGCGNIYFAGTDLIPGANNEDMNSIHSKSRSSTYWQYPSAFPLESVISMSPVGLQYARDPGRGQLVLLPPTSAIESFPQAAFLWPPYMQQNSSAMQTTPNFIFPSMSPQTSALPPTYAAPLQLLGPNYLTTAAASSTVCHHSQATASSFLSISSDTRRTEQSQKHYVMKMEDLFQQNSFSKGNVTSNLEANNKEDKSKDEGSNYLLSNVNLVGPTPLMQNEQSHILMNTTHSPSELITIPMVPANYTIPANIATVTPPQRGEVGSILKNSALRVSGFSKTPEMQDVNIQTDTPACSDDENSNFSCTELISANVQSFDKLKSISTLCHTNCVGCKSVLSKENSIDSLPQCTAAFDFSKPSSSLAFPETYVYENDCASNRSGNNSYNMESTAVVPRAEFNSESSTFKSTSNPAPWLEMSGLELLSNISTGSFVSHESLEAVHIKQEVCENIDNVRTNDFLNNHESYGTNSNTSDISYSDLKEKDHNNDSIKTPTPRGEKLLGGLNLLCALAEQRIQEEVANNNVGNLSKNPSSEAKKRKHKHSKSKSYRQSRYYKEKNKKKLLKDRKRSDLKSDCDDVHNNLKSAFRKVDPNYKKLNKWPDPEDFFKAMESDMRMRLADITRQYRKKKRKLDEINKIKKRKKSSDYKFANISCKNPSFICFLDKFQSTSSNFPPPADETEKKSSNIRNLKIVESIVDTNKNDEATTVALCEGTSSFNLNNQKSSENLVLSEIKSCKNKKYKIKHIPTLKVDRSTSESGPLLTKHQQELQHTKQKQQPQLQQAQQQQNTVIKEENKFASKIDKELVLSNEHLYRKETRVLTDMGGLFYAGILKPLQPPDVYAITLDGERGNKSHIMSREEIFKDAILEVIPTTIKSIPTGTRLCAYWSQQYRCLYPGKAIETDNTDMGSDFVSVEFDDGDSGKIRLQNIRFLLSDYPIVEYNENPFNNLGKNKKSSCTKIKSTSNDSNGETVLESEVQETDKNPLKSRIDKTKNQLLKIASHLSNLSNDVPQHTKHKKKKKHKKHHRKSSSKNSIVVINEAHNEENNKVRELKSDQQAESLNKMSAPENTEIDKTNSNLLDYNVKHENKGLEDEDSNSNVVSETSDEARNERIDYNSAKGSKIAAFLPERQLWGWLGQSYRKAGLKGRPRKQFYKSITRGKETITVGECAVFLSTGRPDRPYIGRIEAMWETTSSNKIVRVRWFYHPEETIGCPILKYPGALFDSPHEDENDVQTISHKCEVIEFSMYIAHFGSDSAQYQSINDNNDTYYLSGYYNPRLQVLKMQPDIPTLDDTSLYS